MNTSPDFAAALSRLDQEIEVARQQLADLQLKRTGAEVFLSYMQTATASSSPAVVPTATADAAVSVPVFTAGNRPLSPTEAVTAAIDALNRGHFTVDDIYSVIEAMGVAVDRMQTRNAMHYLVRKHELENVRRGVYARPTDTKTPAPTGVLGSDQSNSDWSSKEGGIRSDTEPLRDHDLHPGSRDGDRAHDLRAAMMVAPE